MATTPVTPAAAPPAAAPAAATASSSSAGTSGASQSTSTPVTSQPTTQQDGHQGEGALSQEQQVDAMVAAWEDKKPQAVSAAEVTPAAVADPAATVEAGKTEEQKQAEAAAAAEGQDEYSFDEDGFTGAVDLATKLDTVQGLDPALRNEILANARIAEQLAPYREIFGSPEEAKVVAQAAQDFSNVQGIFQSISGDNVAKGTSDLINQMLQMSAYRDETGQPRRREDGTYITDGTTTRFFNEIVDRKLAQIGKKFESDPAVQAALDLVMERAGMRPSTAEKTQDQDPALAQQREQLEAERKQFADQKEADRQASVKQYTDGLNGDLNTLSESSFTALLSKATGVIEPLTRKSVLRELSQAVAKAIKANSSYQLEKRALQAQPMTAARRQQEVALAKKWMAANLTRVAQPILTEAGISVSNKAAKQQETQAAREQASRGEVTGAAPGQQKGGTPQNPAQARQQVAEALKQKLGRVPSDQEINVEMMMNLPGIKNRAA